MNLRSFYVSHPTLLALLLLSASGCFAELRGSSLHHLSEPQSEVASSATSPELSRWLVSAFGRRGFAVTDQRATTGGQMLKFKGARNSITTVVGTQYGVAGSTDTLGSVFYAFISDDGRSRSVRIIGKPMLNNNEVCSDFDAGLDPCDGATTGALWAGREQAMGKEEAEAIRGIYVELANAIPSDGASASASTSFTSSALAPGVAPAATVATTPPATASAPNEPAVGARPRCRASELPQWRDASPPQKKKLLAYCRAAAGSTDP